MNNNSLIYRLYYYKLFGYDYIDECFLLNRPEFSFDNLDEMMKEIKVCNLCELCKSKSSDILPQGSESSEIMAIFLSPSEADE